MRALVTGATGFVGGHLVRRLHATGHEITALVRSPTRAAALAPFGVRLVRGDLADAAALREAVTGQDVVFHVAGVVAAPNEAEFLRINREGTAAVLDAAARAGAPRFVLVSSMAAAGPSPRGRPRAASMPMEPLTAYGRSKRAAEELVRSSHLAWTIIRPPMVYGPGDREVFKIFQLAARALGLVPVFGDGSQELSAVYGPDLAAALVAAAESEATVGGTYYACHPEIFTSGEFAAHVARAVGRHPRLIPIPRPIGRAVLALTGLAAALADTATVLNADKAHEFFAPAWTGDPAPLEQATGWRAATGIAEGIPATARWYREQGWL
ncbi:MAG: NAD-dependent epimerase/dehydratase family protein [Gemmatimonadota bacterium]